MLHRRSLLTGLTAAAALVATRRRAFAADVDVAIVGAGAAGLSAAKELRKHGRSFIIVEARSRLGGRAFTDTSLGIPYDAGAQFIHWAERNPWKEIAGEMGVALADDDRRPGGFQVFAGGKPMAEADRNRRRGTFGALDRRLEEISRDGLDRSVAEAVADMGPDMAPVAASGLLLSLGEDAQRISVKDYQQLWSGDDFVVPSGYGALVSRYGADLDVKIATPVHTIRWDGPGVSLETESGTLNARTAIVTVPVNVLKSGSIRFIPELPATTRDALDGLGMGALTKIALKIEGSRFGLGQGAVLMEAGSPARMMMIEMFADDLDLAVAMCGGDYARELAGLGQAGAVAHVTDLLSSMIGPEVRASIKGSAFPCWWADPFSQGSYSVAKPGKLAARDNLALPIGDRIWIAGEATAGGGAMTVGGASLAGIAAARGVVARLKA
jgi:monoamine oxidase